jgi:type IV pilus assembly protein PilA
MKPLQQRQGGMLGKLMIAVVGVSPAIAFSDNQDHAIRERVSAGLNIAGAAQTLVNDNMHKASSDFSRGWTSQGLKRLNPVVDTIRIDPASGVITVSYSELANGVSVTLTPSADGAGLVAGQVPLEDISWRCSVDNASNEKYVPEFCRM